MTLLRRQLRVFEITHPLRVYHENIVGRPGRNCHISVRACPDLKLIEFLLRGANRTRPGTPEGQHKTKCQPSHKTAFSRIHTSSPDTSKPLARTALSLTKHFR